MKRLLLVIGFLLVFNFAYGEVYVLIDKATSEIKDMSPWNDAVVQPGQEKIALPGKLTDYELQYAPSYYKYKDNKFILNIKKISDEALAQQIETEKATEEALVQEKIRQIAIEALTANGTVLKYVK